jgi:hypothetical protein
LESFFNIISSLKRIEKSIIILKFFTIDIIFRYKYNYDFPKNKIKIIQNLVDAYLIIDHKDFHRIFENILSKLFDYNMRNKIERDSQKNLKIKEIAIILEKKLKFSTRPGYYRKLSDQRYLKRIKALYMLNLENIDNILRKTLTTYTNQERKSPEIEFIFKKLSVISPD